jgi:hypothetical protein
MVTTGSNPRWKNWVNSRNPKAKAKAILSQARRRQVERPVGGKVQRLGREEPIR